MPKQKIYLSAKKVHFIQIKSYVTSFIITAVGEISPLLHRKQSPGRCTFTIKLENKLFPNSSRIRTSSEHSDPNISQNHTRQTQGGVCVCVCVYVSVCVGKLIHSYCSKSPHHSICVRGHDSHIHSK